MLKIKEIREDKNLSQQEVAKAIETSQTNIARWENGKNEPSYLQLVKLANFFNCSIDYLVGNDETEQITQFEPKAVLSEKEKELLRVYQSLSENGKKTLIGSAHNIERFDSHAMAAKKA